MKKSIKAIITLILFLFIGGIATFLYYYKWAINTPLLTDAPKIFFEIKEGESGFEIAERLKNRKITRSDWIFYLNAKIKEKPLISGVYELSASMSIKDIHRIISDGETTVVKVTIPEGYRAEQIAVVLEQKVLVSYSDFIAYAKVFEGKLFPDTYYFTPDKTVKEIVDTMLENFQNRTKDLSLSDQDIIIASIIEREVANDADRALISGIFRNRLQSRMKLESDPTVKYALDNDLLKKMSESDVINFDFWKQPVILSTVKNYSSAYNTYYVSGFPSGPICNPGTSSIMASVNYQKSDYLYFINDRDGKIYPAKTFTEHNQNIKKYMDR